MKLAIIGAGTCGLYLGWKLAKKGGGITIFEKNSGLGNKVCSGLFSERILQFVPESKKLIEKEINSVFIHFPKKTIRVNFSKKFLIINHSKLDNLLLDLAQLSGTEIILNKTISELPEGFDRIIGCDGAYSFVRRALNLPNPFLRLGIQGFAAGSSNDNFVEVWPCKNGFLWKIPHKNQTEYGIIANLNEAYKIFNKFLEQNKILIKNVKARVIPQGLIVPLNPSIKASTELGRMSSGQVTLCGDAAGLTKPWSGGGVIWGLTAADILLETFPDFQAYSKKIKRFFTFKILISKLAVKLVYFLGFNIPWLLPNRTTIESDFLLK